MIKKYYHGGNNKVLHDFSINLNPLGVMNCVKYALKKYASSSDFYLNYPPEYPLEVESLIAINKNIESDKISLGVGASELIDRLTRVINPKQGLLLSPCFSEYERCLNNQNSNIIYHDLNRNNNFHLEFNVLDSINKLNCGDIFFICTPNNPNGLLVSLDILIKCINLCEEKGIYLVIDISFLDFTNGYKINVAEKSSLTNEILYYDEQLNKLIINSNFTILLNTFTKMYSIPSLRIGYCISNNKELIEKVNKLYIPWSISTLAQTIVIEICKDKNQLNWVENTKKSVTILREKMIQNLSIFPLTIFECDANYILFYENTNIDLKSELLKYNIAIRDCSDYRKLEKGFYRISIKNEIANNYLIKMLKIIYGE